MADRQEIYEFVAERGRPSVLPAPWQTINTESPFFQPEVNSLALLADLQETFSTADLLDACVVQETAEGLVNLHPALQDPNAAVLALRQHPDSQPFALLTADECFDRTEWPLAACLQDYRTLAGLKSGQGRLLISFAPADLQVLWSLGFPVAPATHLAGFGRDRIDTLCAALHWPRRPRKHSATSGDAAAQRAKKSSISLALVGWCVAQTDRCVPAELQMVQQHFAALHGMLRFPVNLLTLWQPPPTEIEGLRFCRDTGDRVDVQDALGHSLQNHCGPVVEVPTSVTPVSTKPNSKAPVETELSYSALRHEWLSPPDPYSSGSHRQRIWEQLRQVQAKQLIEPLLAEAEQSSDPLVRNALVGLANANDWVHTQQLRILDRFNSIARQTSSSSKFILPPEEFIQWLSLQKQVDSMTRSLLALLKGPRR